MHRNGANKAARKQSRKSSNCDTEETGQCLTRPYIYGTVASRNGELVGLDHLLAGTTDFGTLASLLKRCRALSDGKRIHAHVRQYGYDRSTFMGNFLVEMYGNCGSAKDAQAVFDKMCKPNLFSWNILIKAYGQNGNLEGASSIFGRMPHRDVVSWTAMISAYVQNGQGKEALDIFCRMQLEGFKPNRITFVCALDACTSLLALEEGLDVHTTIVNNGHEQDVVIGTALINMFGKCGSLSNASSVFCGMPHRDVVTWNAMIGTFAQNGLGKEALDLFYQLQLKGFTPNKVTFLCTLEACVNLAVLEEGQEIHVAISNSGYELDVAVGNTLINMYGKCRSLIDAIRVFDRMPHRDIVSWNAIIGAFAQNEHGKEALDVFWQMQLQGIKPDKITFLSSLEACSSISSLEEGWLVHAAIVEAGLERDVVIGTALIDMYSTCRSHCDVSSVFGSMHHRDAIVWTAVIAAFVHNGNGKKALNFFKQMQLDGIKPDKIAFICALDACASLVDLGEGQAVHAAIAYGGFQQDVEVGNALINMYGKCGSLSDASSVFGRMPHRDALSWTAMIAAFAKYGEGKECLDLYHWMQVEGVTPDYVIFVCALEACASLAALQNAQEIHASIIVDAGCEGDALVHNALVNLYGKCGCVDDARRVFCGTCHQDVVSWTTMIGVLAQNGHSQEALNLFYRMQEEGIMPDKVTFICVLTACSHVGQVEDGKHHFVSMNRDHSIKPTEDHYVCMVDLLGRAGHLDEAEDLITNIPTEKAAMAWLCLLGACRIHGDVDRGMYAADHCLKLDSKNTAPYIMLSNIFASAGRCVEATPATEALKTYGLNLQLGCFSTELSTMMHDFLVGQIEGTHAAL